MTYIYIIFPSLFYSTKFAERDHNIFVKYNTTAGIGDVSKPAYVHGLISRIIIFA